MSTNTGPGPDPEHSGYPAGAYQPGYPAGAYQPGGHTGANTAGRVGLAFGIVVVLAGLVQQIIGLMLPYLMNRYDLSAAAVSLRFSLAGGVLIGVLGLVAVIAGGIGLSGSGKPKAAAGAGFALGVSAILSVLVGVIAAPAIGALI